MYHCRASNSEGGDSCCQSVFKISCPSLVLHVPLVNNQGQGHNRTSPVFPNFQSYPISQLWNSLERQLQASCVSLATQRSSGITIRQP